MGYTTDFDGKLSIEPPLSSKEVEFLNKFTDSRRMERVKGEYHFDEDSSFDAPKATDIINYNRPPESQPSLWCDWKFSEDGTSMEWNGSEKSYCMAEWLSYLLAHFLLEGNLASKKDDQFSFLTGHTIEGVVYAQGEEHDDRWAMVAMNNKAFTANADIASKIAWHGVDWPKKF